MKPKCGRFEIRGAKFCDFVNALPGAKPMV